MPQKTNHNLIDTVKAACLKHSMLPEGTLALAAVSGGPDSVCMLHALNALRGELGMELAVAHLDHGVRGKASAADARFVEKLAAKMGLPFFGGRIGVDVKLPIRTGSPEDILREARLEFLKETAIRAGASRIALGHNWDDRSETVLLRIIRGTSADGLAGMRPVNLPFVRPLFDCPRSGIEAYCEKNKLDFRTDKTNFDNKYLRNRVRHTLLPLLETEFNPRIRENLLSLASLTAEDSDFMNSLAAAAMSQVTVAKKETGIRLDAEKLKKLPPPVLKRVLRDAALDLMGQEGGRLESGHIDGMAALLLEDKAGRAIDLPSGIFVTRKYNELEIRMRSGKSKRKKTSAPRPAGISGTPGIVELQDFGIRVEITEMPFNSSMLKNPYPSIAFFSRAHIPESFVVRTWKTGDRFHPLGMQKTKKLSEFFVDAKIDREARERTPLFVAGKEIFWVAGVRISEKFKIDPAKSKRVLCFRISPVQNGSLVK